MRPITVHFGERSFGLGRPAQAIWRREPRMSFYAEVILPRLCHLAMRNRDLLPYRRRTVEAAQGRVLEIGIGSGINLPFYRSPVTELIGLEPSPALLAMARRAMAETNIPVRLIDAGAEAIPLDDHSVDTVVTTWTLCTIPEATKALREVRRVLRPRGHLLFVEHGLAPDRGVRRWQDILTPAWKRVSGGCHLNRPIRGLVEGTGFKLVSLETGYMRGPKPMTFMYQGSARPN